MEVLGLQPLFCHPISSRASRQGQLSLLSKRLSSLRDEHEAMQQLTAIRRNPELHLAFPSDSP